MGKGSAASFPDLLSPPHTNRQTYSAFGEGKPSYTDTCPLFSFPPSSIRHSHNPTLQRSVAQEKGHHLAKETKPCSTSDSVTTTSGSTDSICEPKKLAVWRNLCWKHVYAQQQALNESARQTMVMMKDGLSALSLQTPVPKPHK